MHREKNDQHFHKMLLVLPGLSLSKIVTLNPFFCKNNAFDTPCIPAPTIPTLIFLFTETFYS